MSVTVVYDNSTRRLDVTLIIGSDAYTTAATVDLSSLLPEYVVVGFSATTKNAYASNHTVVLVRFKVK
ncbi:hypothetical protein PVAP13_7KG122416 [Panicum virgatum]|uniref:Legume lectin domain-containing protein n=1 Tax=Panicum virgatum TaxID=38727 RepID=A0A8T0QMI2_PANVG|nr:hypothetical protein PVAP13_7KG122416 [Panicum virgatum]